MHKCSKSASKAIYSGGLDRLHDKSISGGRIMKVYNILTKETVPRIIGDDMKVKLLNLNLNWNYLLENFWDDKLSNEEYYEVFIKQIEITLYPKRTFSQTSGIDMYDEILNSLQHDYENFKEFFNNYLQKSLAFNEIQYYIAIIIMAYSGHFIRLLGKFNSLRTKYIKKIKSKDIINDLKKLDEQWNELMKSHSIEASNNLLLFVNPPATPKDLNWYRGDSEKWNYPPAVFYFDIHNNGDMELLNAIETLKKGISAFKMKRLCVKSLSDDIFTFPLGALNNAIDILEKKLERETQREVRNKQYSAVLKACDKFFQKFKGESVPTIKIKKQKTINTMKREMKEYISIDWKSLNDKQQKIVKIRWLAEQIIDMINKNRKYFESAQKIVLNVLPLLISIHNKVLKLL
jgi:hypothetical protein